MAFQHALSTNNYGTAKFIVSSSAANGTHTTIASAIADAVSGETIFIRPGTYTENLTLKAGVNLAAYDCDAFSGTVTISGKCSYSESGQVDMSGIRLQTNGDYALEVTGANASAIILTQCQVVNTNNTAINFTSSNAGSSINLNYCLTFVGATNALFTSSSAGSINCFWCQMSNSSTTASAMSAGSFQMSNCYSTDVFSFSSTSQIVIFNSSIRTFGINTTALTNSGTSSGKVINTYFESGTASAISVGGTLTVSGCVISSSNANAITGAGTLTYSGLSFIGSSTTINTTTKTQIPAIGTTGAVLQSNGAGALPSFSTATYPTTATANSLLYASASNVVSAGNPSGVPIKLGTATASNSASISFTSLISATYSTYLVILNNVLPATNGAALLLTYSTDNGSTYLNTNYRWAYTYTVPTANGRAGSASDSSISINNGVGNASGNGVSGHLYFYNLNVATNFPLVQGMTSAPDNASTTMLINTGNNSNTTGVNAIKFAYSSGNITSGTFTLYGIVIV